jgi:hypothetical protein
MHEDKIPDFTETEVWVVSQTLKERYGKDIELAFGDAEIRLNPEVRTLVNRPVLFWKEKAASFVIMKVADKAFRTQFYYRGFQQYGTGATEYDEIGDCVVTLLQVQADHERNEALNPVDPGPVAQGPGSNDSNNLEYSWD